MAHVIRVRDVARSRLYEFGPDEPVLRGPYDLFDSVAAVRRNGEIAEWFLHDGVVKSGRVIECSMKDVHPGERVLVKVPPSKEDEWWLCEVESVDGAAVA